MRNTLVLRCGDTGTGYDPVSSDGEVRTFGLQGMRGPCRLAIGWQAHVREVLEIGDGEIKLIVLEASSPEDWPATVCRYKD